jgi:hypothetical protein
MVVAVERQDSADGRPVQARLRVLSYINLETMVDAQGATWLDKGLLARDQSQFVDQGFGAEVKQALARRRQWLVDQSLATASDGGTFRPAPNMLAQLRQRELTQAITQLARELNLEYFQVSDGDRVSGTYRQPVNLASGRYAIIQKAQEFTLVPWQPQLERHRDKPISGTVSGNTISWDWHGRRRGLEI